MHHQVTQNKWSIYRQSRWR